MNDTKIIQDYIQHFYLDIKSKIMNHQSEKILIIDEEKEKLKDVDLLTLLHYIKESVSILIQIKCEEEVKKIQKEMREKLFYEGDKLFFDAKEELISKEKPNLFSQQAEYEKLLVKLEADVRSHIKVEYQMKLHNEYLEAKMEDYEDMENELERMQKKIEKYEEKISTTEYSTVTDKKENEILILRAENTNLKNTIYSFEEKLKYLNESESKLKTIKEEYEKELDANCELISKLKKKIQNFEKLHLSGESHHVNKLSSSLIEKVRKINLNKSDYVKENEKKQLEISNKDQIQQQSNTYRKPTSEILYKNINSNHEQITSTNTIGNNSLNANFSLSTNQIKNFTKLKIPLNLKRPGPGEINNLFNKKTITSPLSSGLKNTNSIIQTNLQNSQGKLNRVSSTGNIKNLGCNNSSNNKSLTSVNFSSLKQYVHSQVPRNKILNKHSNISTMHMKSTSMSNQ